MTHYEVFWLSFLGGVFLMIAIIICQWHIEEIKCQKLHDVYDCEYLQSPFLPAPQKEPTP